MNKRLPLLLLLALFGSVAEAAVFTSAQDGFWSDSATWGGVKPSSNGDKVIIRGNKVVTVNTTESLNCTAENAFEIGKWDGTGGTLNVTSGGALSITGEVYIGVGGNETTYLNVYGGSFVSNYCARLGWAGNVIATITSGSMYIGNLQMAPAGSGILHIDGGTVTVGALQFGTNGKIDITGGQLVVPGTVTNVNIEYGAGKITAYGGARALVYDTSSYPGKTVIFAEWIDNIDHDMFAGGVSRAELESFLSRSLMMGALCTADGCVASQNEFDEAMNMIERIGEGLDPNIVIEAAAGFWSCPSTNGVADFETYYNIAKDRATQAHKRNPYLILGAAIFETAYSAYDEDGYPRPGVEQVPVPGWVFTAFGETPITRNFIYNDMIFEDGLFANRWGINASVPDMTRPETKKWFYYHACRLIDSGYEIINLGQIGLMTAHDYPDYTNAMQVIKMIRAYAATHARRKWVFMSADTHGVVDGTRHSLFDYHSFPLRPKCVVGHPGEAILDASYVDSIYKRSGGGISPFDNIYYAHLPYTVHFDNMDGYNHEDHDHTKTGVSAYVWNWDESAWFANQPELYRNNWLWYASKWIRANDPNGYICMSGRKICQDPVAFNGNLEWMYKANTYSPSINGSNQEETIKAIWNSTCSGYNNANLNNDCTVDIADLAAFAQKWHNVTAGYYAIDLQDFNGDHVVDLKDLALFMQSWLLSF